MPIAQKKELVKLRVLVHLTDPAAIEFGATTVDIARHVKGEQGVTLDALLANMVSEGLIDRRIEDGRQAKPYFINEAGRRHLEQQTSKAIFPEISKKGDWATSQSTQRLGDVLAEQLRLLPEFRQADEDRIQHVGKLLAEFATGRSQSA